jgi:tartrate dehydratase alpha subunit/fumarate hydratase class I-like protein
MNNLGCGPRGIGGNAFLLHVAVKAIIRGLQKEGWNEKV